MLILADNAQSRTYDLGTTMFRRQGSYWPVVQKVTCIPVNLDIPRRCSSAASASTSSVSAAPAATAASTTAAAISTATTTTTTSAAAPAARETAAPT